MAIDLSTDDLVAAIIKEKPGDAVQQTRGGSALVGYWINPLTRWVTIGPHARTDPDGYAEFRVVRGFVPLPDKFGVEVGGRGYMLGKDGTTQFIPFIQNGGLTYVDERGEFTGTPGAYLMPKDQIVAYNWHRKPEFKARRPDVADVIDYPCPYGCLDKFTRSVVQFTSEFELMKHLQNDPVHKNAAQQHAMTEAIQNAVSQNTGNTDVVQMAGVISEALAMALAKYFPAPPLPPAAPVAVATEAKPRYPDGEPDTTWQRTEMMAWAKDNGLSQVLNTSMNTADVLRALTTAILQNEGAIPA